MDIRPSEIKQFQQLYITKFGIELDNKTARHKLLKLVRQMHEVYRPVTQDQMATFKAKNANEDTSDETVKPE